MRGVLTEDQRRYVKLNGGSSYGLWDRDGKPTEWVELPRVKGMTPQLWVRCLKLPQIKSSNDISYPNRDVVRFRFDGVTEERK